jgi:hypothetical protein
VAEALLAIQSLMNRETLHQDLVMKQDTTFLTPEFLSFETALL